MLAALISLLVVSASGVVGAVSAYAQYTQARASAEAGMTHLRAAQTIISPLMKHPTLPDTQTMTQLQTELGAAERNFAAARQEANSGAFGLASNVPGPGGTVHSVAALLAAADEACLAGLDLTSGLLPVVAVAQGGFFAPTSSTSASTTPTLTQEMLDTLTAKFEDAVTHINSAMSYLQSADLSSLPSQIASPQQVGQIRGVLANWPSIQTRLSSADGWLHVAPALLGIGKPTRLLVEIMDRAEMRSTGGFIGAYGVLTISKGKIQPFALQDVFTLDVPYVNRIGYSAPPATYSWWPFKGFGLRDSNLSPDFPTSARLGMSMLAKEGGPQVQGVVGMNATVIARMLKIIGSVKVPGYDVTVTDKNLEAMIRLYTETSAQRDGNDLPVSDQVTSIHERFTALLGREMMAKAHVMKGAQNAAVVQALLASFGLKDMQIYLSDPKAETLVSQLGFDGAVAQGPGDAVTIADSNLTGNKATAFTTLTYTDAVTLDAQGAATHHLAITYLFSSASNPDLIHFLYKRDYYLTYLRVYAPKDAHLVSYGGFNGGQTQINHTDLPGRQMWGGLVDLQDGVTYTLHFVWTTPAAATRDAQGRWNYSLVYQHQSGANQQLNLTITAPGAKDPSVVYKGAISKDLTFTLSYS